ncbi:MAG: SBBP repeat-containing protein [Promethearchaeota archaeon]
MIKNKTKNHIFLLIGIFCCLVLVSNALKSSPISFKTSEQSLGVISAAKSIYKSDLIIFWGGKDGDSGNDIALDDSGNIYITGNTKSFGAGHRDAFIAKFDSAGNSLLNITWGGGGFERGNDIALDDSNNIYITGNTESFGAGYYDAFIAKYDSAGNSLLNITWGGSDSDSGTDIALDDSGNIYITGGTESFGGGQRNAFIAKFDSAGNSLLNITWGGGGWDYAHSIVLDDSGNIYITGGTGSFGAGSDDAFIAKYDSTGNSLLNITWGRSKVDSGNSIALDDSGNIYITGSTENFGAGHYDAFIAKYDSAGNSLLNITWGGSDSDSGRGIVLDASGNIYITGRTYSFGAGQCDAFIAKYDSAGNSLLNITWGGGGLDTGRDIALDDSNNIYITGNTYSFGAGYYDAFIVKYLSGDDTPRISGYNIFFLLGILSVIVIIISKKSRKTN